MTEYLSDNTIKKKKRKKKKDCWEFPGGLEVRIPGFHCCGPGSIPAQGTEILQLAQHGPKKKKFARKRKRNRVMVKK